MFLGSPHRWARPPNPPLPASTPEEHRPPGPSSPCSAGKPHPHPAPPAAGEQGNPPRIAAKRPTLYPPPPNPLRSHHSSLAPPRARRLPISATLYLISPPLLPPGRPNAAKPPPLPAALAYTCTHPVSARRCCRIVHTSSHPRLSVFSPPERSPPLPRLTPGVNQETTRTPPVRW